MMQKMYHVRGNDDAILSRSCQALLHKMMKSTGVVFLMYRKEASQRETGDKTLFARDDAINSERERRERGRARVGRG